MFLFGASGHAKVIIDILKKQNIEIHVRSVLLQGLFFMGSLPEYLLGLEKNLLKLNICTNMINLTQVKQKIKYLG